MTLVQDGLVQFAYHIHEDITYVAVRIGSTGGRVFVYQGMKDGESAIKLTKEFLCDYLTPKE
jgi:hypothetical protein